MQLLSLLLLAVATVFAILGLVSNSARYCAISCLSIIALLVVRIAIL